MYPKIYIKHSVDTRNNYSDMSLQWILYYNVLICQLTSLLRPGSKCILLPHGLSAGDRLSLLVKHDLHWVPKLEGPFLHDELTLAGVEFLPGGDDSASIHLDSPVELVHRLQTWGMRTDGDSYERKLKVTCTGWLQLETIQRFLTVPDTTNTHFNALQILFERLNE